MRTCRRRPLRVLQMRPVWSELTVTSSRPFGEYSASLTSCAVAVQRVEELAGRGVPELGHLALRRRRAQTARRDDGMLSLRRNPAHELAGIGVDAHLVREADEKTPAAGREPEDTAGDVRERRGVAGRPAVDLTVRGAQNQRSRTDEDKRRPIAARLSRRITAVHGDGLDVALHVDCSEFASLRDRGADRRAHRQRLEHLPAGGEDPGLSAGDADRIVAREERRHGGRAGVDRLQRPLRQSVPEPRAAVGRSRDDGTPARVEADARDSVAVTRERGEEPAVLAVVEAPEPIVRGRRDLAAVRAEDRVVGLARRADEQELTLTVRDIPDVGGTVLARGHERAAVGREMLGQDVSAVREDVEQPARVGFPDPGRTVVAAARQQLPVRAERERADTGPGQTPDHAAGSRAEDRRRGRLA